jgi:hypothetical protein
MIISISELQKNISILGNLKEPLLVKDKRKNRIVAKIVPVEEGDFLDELERRAPVGICVEDLESAIQEAREIALREKYGGR